MKLLTFILGLPTFAFRLLAKDTVSVTGADVTETGIYTARVVGRSAVPGAASGTNEWLDTFMLTQVTTNVLPGLARGSPSNAPIVLTMVGEHPPYKNPKTGKTETRDEYTLQSWIAQTYTSYSLDEEWDLISGKFKFEVWYKGKKLCEQSFMVVPDTKPEDKT
jgi:hypothetical protein